MFILIFGLFAVAVRLIPIWISTRNEKQLKSEGAQEYGVITTKYLAVTHALYYLCAILEWLAQSTSTVTVVTYTGFMLYACGMFCLAMVIRDLGPYWTSKLIISPGHKRIRRGIYKYLKHPNYFMNLVPELIGIAMIMQAHLTPLIGLPIYALLVRIRIMQETFVMVQKFPDYAA